MKCLVTGGAGFIGSQLARRLIADGHDVAVLDNLSTGRLENLREIFQDVRFIEGDLRDTKTVERAMIGVEVVFHEGAIPSVPKSIADPQTTMDVGVTGTLNVLLAASGAGVRRVVFASSSAVYGDTEKSPKREDFTPRPMSPYAISKLTGEQLCEVFFRTRGLETVSLRYFNVYGPGQHPSSDYAAVIPSFARALANGDRPIIHGDGEQTRDFVFVSDVVNANVLAARANDAAGCILNVASGQAVSINRILQVLSNSVGIASAAERAPARVADIRYSVADIGRARLVLGFEPSISLDEGIDRVLAAQRARFDLLCH